MSLIRESQAREAAVRARARRGYVATARILEEQRDPRVQRYDIFLSHSVKDADLVLGVKQILEDFGHSVYVDWIEDSQLDRNKVSRDSADVLRARMKCCDSLFYLHTWNSPSSKWMPWELGFFDGHNGNVAILPVIRDTDSDTFQGQEYLALYPHVDIAGVVGQSRHSLWVNNVQGQYVGFQRWKNGDRSWSRAY